jgi:hypothetical protein
LADGLILISAQCKNIKYQSIKRCLMTNLRTLAACEKAATDDCCGQCSHYQTRCLRVPGANAAPGQANHVPASDLATRLFLLQEQKRAQLAMRRR